MSVKAPSSSTAMSPLGEACARTIGLAPSDGIRSPQRIEQRSIDEHRMTVTNPRRRPNDRRVRSPITVDHGSDRVGANERNIDQRDQRGDDPGTIDDRETGDER